jgi:phage-related holin
MNILKKHYVIFWITVNWLIVALCIFIDDVFNRGELFSSELFKQTFIYLPGYLLMVFPFSLIEFINSKRKKNKIIRFSMFGLILLISLYSAVDTFIRFIAPLSPNDIFKQTFGLKLSSTIKIKKCTQKRYMNEAVIVFYIYSEKAEVFKLLHGIGVDSENQCKSNHLSKQKSTKEWLNSSNEYDILYYFISIPRGSKMEFINIALNKKATKCVIEIHW